QEHREGKYLQNGTVLWLTGLSGSGKTTLANHLERILFDQGKLVYVLDGDKIRNGLSSDLGFSAEDRFENIRRIGEVARLFTDAGLIVIVAFISPFRKDRDSVRMAMTPGRFIEVFVDSPLEICEKRDTKGLYKKARAGMIEDFTGISSPYEPPLSAEVHLRTDKETIDESVGKVLHYLKGALLFHGQ
ncbi:MAG TPA: adenylyl-sulfate kinase, partial [Sulfurimonas sp.]|nr:adenylyl-sulfate kinase [Sulfurimonas sp.]